MSSIQMYSGIKVSIKKRFNGNFSGTHKYNVRKAWIIRHHNRYSCLQVSINRIMGTTTMSTSDSTQVHMNFLLTWYLHFNKYKNKCETF